MWEVPSTASVAKARAVVGAAVPGFGQATIVILTNTQTGSAHGQGRGAGQAHRRPHPGGGGHQRPGQDGRRLAQRRPAQRHRPVLGLGHHRQGDPGGDHLPDRRHRLHLAALRGQDGPRRPDRPGARHPVDHRDLLDLRLSGQPGHGDRLSHRPRLLAVRHHRRLRQGAGEHPRPGVDQPAHLLGHRQPVDEPGAGPVDQHLAGRHPARSFPSWSSGPGCSAPPPCRTSGWPCSSA